MYYTSCKPKDLPGTCYMCGDPSLVGRVFSSESTLCGPQILMENPGN